jgi:uncharacterized protein YndB with AHSA1/START domain/DNA-binding MarR family transcriptional regulator
MDDVFKALADPGRRKLLDALFRKDGQTMTELQSVLPMSRFGVMKHLQILEKAGLITSTKVGRERMHYLNPVPIQQVYDRWVSKYAGTFAGALTRLKYELEDTPSMPETWTHVYEIYIRTTPVRLWQALTDGDDTVQYYFGARAENMTAVGEPYRLAGASGKPFVDGRVLESDPPRRLVTTFIPHFAESNVETTVIYEITPYDGMCRLTLRHEGLVVGDETFAGFADGWARIFSALKSYLESPDSTPVELN